MVALVTGASSGIGRDIAIELAKRKYDIIAIARNEEALIKLKEEVEKTYNVNVEVKAMDLTDRNGCIKLHEDVKVKYGAIDVLINDAGFGTCGEFTKTDLNKEIGMIDTNIVALHILTKLFLQDMVEVNRGHIMNVASIAGFMPGPLMATYYSTKAYVVRLTQSIRQELFMKHSKVKISALCPGPVNTNFNNVAGVKFNLRGKSSEYVANYAIENMLKGKLIILPGITIKLAKAFSEICPDAIKEKIAYHMQKKKM